MSDFPEAIGTASEGGLFARAISRESGGSSTDADGHFAETACLNCGTELVGPHCHTCGQQAHLHRTLSAVGHDLVHGVLHLDGKLWHTLPLLAWRPGDLTRRYIAGERASFVSPMAMFLFTVFLMFAVFQAIGFTTPANFGGANMGKIGDDLGKMREELVEDRSERREDLTQAQARETDAKTIAEIEADIAELDQEIAGIDRGRKLILGEGKEAARGGYTVTGDTDVALFKKLNEKWRKHPELMLYKLQANSYKFSWLLIPISLPFIWLLFAWRREFKAYDHAVFVTYSLAFMSLLFIALSMLGKIGVPFGWLAAAGTFGPLVHIYRQLRGTYEISRFGAAWRTIVLSWMILFIISIFLYILVVLGAF